MNERGEATVALSIAGAFGAGLPVAVGVALTTENVTNGFAFVVALFVGLVSIGTGVGKLYGRWKQQIEASLRRDELLADLCARVARIEDRQTVILRHLGEL
jgi:hypothetical protein